jgi:hypothetical protein
MAEDQPASLVEQVRTIVREELHAFHTKSQRRWYEREPFRGLGAHVITAIVAVSVGYGLHILTGAPINIEVATAKDAPSTTASPAAAPSSLADFAFVLEDAGSSVACVTLASSAEVVAVVPPKKVPKKVQGLALGTLPVPATAAAPAAAPVPASTPPSEIDNADIK